MNIIPAADIRKADQYTIEHEPISSTDLMERAAGKCVEWIDQNIELKDSKVFLFVGIGNNGGDGLVIARQLAERGVDVYVYILRFSEKASQDFQLNYDRLAGIDLKINELKDDKIELSIGHNDVLIDAVFGSGLNKAVSGWLKGVFDKINKVSCLKIAIDIPSGLFAEDNRDNDLTAIIRADVTLTFQTPKLAFLMESSGQFCGDWTVLDIGLNEQFLSEIKSNYQTIDQEFLSPMLKEREKFGHKGSYGHALIIAGSKGKMGASVLATRACLRSGIGLLTNLCPAMGYEIIQNSIPEAMSLVSDGQDFIKGCPDDLTPYNVIGVGPGLGQYDSAPVFLLKLFRSFKNPMVLDADALNVLSNNKELISSIPKESILTPHPGEFRRLVGTWKNDFDKLEKQLAFSANYKVILVLKGAHTCITEPNGQVYFNTTGNPGMATAGSGDVLLGIITGLLGRGYNSLQAAQLGVYLHGLAGDFAASQFGEESMVAGDIISHLADGFQYIYEQ
jgi:NAD(P)H-hydrate epimerase